MSRSIRQEDFRVLDIAQGSVPGVPAVGDRYVSTITSAPDGWTPDALMECVATSGTKWAEVTAPTGQRIIDDATGDTYEKQSGGSWLRVTYTKKLLLDIRGKGIGGTAPIAIIHDNFGCEEFSLTDKIYRSFNKPSDYNSGDITVRIHFYQVTATASQEVKWEMVLGKAADGGSIAGDTATVNTGDVALSGTQEQEQNSVLTIAEANVDDHMGIEFGRAAVTDGTEADDVGVIYLIAEYKAKVFPV